MSFEDSGLMNAVRNMLSIDWDDAVRNNLTMMYNRGKNRYGQIKGGTPFITGELRESLGFNGKEVGYTKEYAPHVEYGHRLRGGGYVEGKHYLRDNADVQEPIFHADIIRHLKKAGG